MTLAATPPVELPLETLNEDQKWRLFQFLWKEVAEKHHDEIEPPSWHDEVLMERMEKIQSGKAVWHDFDEAFENLRRKLT